MKLNKQKLLEKAKENAASARAVELDDMSSLIVIAMFSTTAKVLQGIAEAIDEDT